jgi:hypothetical protein
MDSWEERRRHDAPVDNALRRGRCVCKSVRPNDPGNHNYQVRHDGRCYCECHER